MVHCLRLPRSITLDHLLFYIAALLDARAYTFTSADDSPPRRPMELEGSKIVRLELGTEELRVRQRLRQHKTLAVGFEIINHVVIGPVLEITQFERCQPYPTEDEDRDGKPRGELGIFRTWNFWGWIDGRRGESLDQSLRPKFTTSANDQPECQCSPLRRRRGPQAHLESIHCADRLGLHSKPLS